MNNKFLFSRTLGWLSAQLKLVPGPAARLNACVRACLCVRVRARVVCSCGYDDAVRGEEVVPGDRSPPTRTAQPDRLANRVSTTNRWPTDRPRTSVAVAAAAVFARRRATDGGNSVRRAHSTVVGPPPSSDRSPYDSCTTFGRSRCRDRRERRAYRRSIVNESGGARDLLNGVPMIVAMERKLISELIDEYKTCTCLWRIKDPDYKNKEMKNEAYESLLQLIKKYNSNNNNNNEYNNIIY